VSGLSQMVAGATDILSPSLGALLLGLMRLHTIMAIDVVTAAFAIAPLLFVRIPQPERSTTIASASGGKPSLWADAWAGVRYIWGWPGLSILWMVALLLNLLCGPAFYLTPILVTKFFRGGAMQLGWANSIWGVGAVLGGLVLSIWGGSRRRVVTLFLAVIGVGLGFLLVAFAPATVFPLALAGLFAVGAISAISGGLFPVLFQEIVAPEMQGRVFAMWGSLVSLMLMIGMAIAGPVADRLGVRVPYLVGGLSQVLIGAGAFAVPALMHLEDKGRP
jgi:DHA3 family macrolide efflux protein-like MFS transporter